MAARVSSIGPVVDAHQVGHCEAWDASRTVRAVGDPGRTSMETRPHRRTDTGALIFGLILLLVGGYYMLTETFQLNLPELDWDRIWPLIILVIGAGILWNAWSRRQA
jgi:hypothetical protein